MLTNDADCRLYFDEMLIGDQRCLTAVLRVRGVCGLGKTARSLWQLLWASHSQPRLPWMVTVTICNVCGWLHRRLMAP